MGKKNKASTKVKYLPVEIEENILSRVPVKTILRFISVCKSWYFLFLDPRFDTIYQRNNCTTLLIARLYNTDEFVVTDTLSVIHSRHVVNPRLDQSNRHPFFLFGPHLDIHRTMVVYCDGIACIHDSCPLYNDAKFSEYICLWNPALRVVKYIHKRVGRLGVRVLVGFGFDIRFKDYKVIRYEESVFDKELKKVEIYSLSSDSWRTVKGATKNIKGFFTSTNSYARASGVYVNETHHWAIISRNYEDLMWPFSAIIISFNMRDEVFKKITVPSEICKKMELRLILFNYKESLATLTWANNNLEVWVMKDCGMSESWTKVCKIDLPKTAYFQGFVEDKNEVIFSKPRHDGNYSIVIDTDKLEMKDDSSTANIEALNDAVEVTSFRNSLTLLGSKSLVHYQ